ncbi:MAG: hypothetical protein ACOYOB_18340 [Myxococcota bacterium]
MWSPLHAPSAAISAAKQADLKKKALSRNIASVAWPSPNTRELFDELQIRLLARLPGVIEVPSEKSVVYHGPSGNYFVEVLPRKDKLVLLLGLDFSDCDGADGNLGDARSYKFLANATQTGGAFYNLCATASLDTALRLAVQAYDATVG